MFGRHAFFDGRVQGGVKDLAWFTAEGVEMTDEHWRRPAETLGMYLDGDAVQAGGPGGDPVTAAAHLVVLHAGPADCLFRLPGQPWAKGYQVVPDTTPELPGAAVGTPMAEPATATSRPALAGGEPLAVGARSLVLLRVGR